MKSITTLAVLALLVPALLRAGSMDGAGTGGSAQSSEASAMTSATQAGRGYTLDDCYQAALAQSESLSITGEAITQAQDRYHEAISTVVPNITIVGQTYDQSAGLGGVVPTVQNYLRISATQNLFEGMREYAALRQTKDQLVSAKEAYAWAGWQLYGNTAQAFNMVLSAEKNLADLNFEIKLYGERITFLQGWLNIGRAQDTDLLSVQSAQAQIKAQIELAKYTIVAAREALSFLTGLPVDIQLQDTQSLPSQIGGVDDYLSGLDQRPDVEAARKNFEAAKEGVGIAWGAHLPAVSAEADYYPYRYAPDTDINWDAYLTVSMPIFMGGLIHAQTHAAESVRKQAELALQQTLRLDGETLRSAYQKLHFDLSQKIALTDAADLANKDYKAETRNFERGLVTNLDVLQAMVTYVNTVQSLDATGYAALSDYQNLLAQVGRVKGLPTSYDQK